MFGKRWSLDLLEGDARSSRDIFKDHHLTGGFPGQARMLKLVLICTGYPLASLHASLKNPVAFVNDIQCVLLVMRSSPSSHMSQGLGDAGKTRFLYNCKLGETCLTIPTIGFNVETIGRMIFWEVGWRNQVTATAVVTDVRRKLCNIHISISTETTT